MQWIAARLQLYLIRYHEEQSIPNQASVFTTTHWVVTRLFENKFSTYDSS